MVKNKRSWFVALGISIPIFLFAAILITYPLIFHLGEYATGLSDELLIAWNHSWVIHSLFSGNSTSLFDANIYYPYKNTLAYSDLYLTTSLISLPVVLLIGEPIAANNFIIIFSLWFLGTSVFALSYYMTKNFFASLLSGLLVIVSPAVLDKKVHIQILSIGFVPLSILFFLLFLKKMKLHFLAISLMLFLLQTYTSFLPGYFIIISYVIILLFHVGFKKTQAKKIIKKESILLCVIALLLLIPIVVPYYQVSKEFNYTRDIRDSIHLGLHPEDLLYTSTDSRLSPYINNLPFNQSSQNNEFKPGFLGFVFTIGAIYCLYFFFRYRKRIESDAHSLLTVALLGLVLSFGPFLHLGRQTVHDPFPIPLPYALFYYVLPGFQGFRNSARWEMLFIILMAVVIAIVLTKVLKKRPQNQNCIIYAVLIFGIITEFNFPMQISAKVPQKKDFPKVYYWLNTTPKDAKIIEMPIYTWNMQPYVFDENMREYYSTIHFRKMVNGASGYSPEPWQEMVRELLETFPDDKSVMKLRKMGISFIIVHKQEYDKLNRDKYSLNNNALPNGSTVLSELKNNTELELVNYFDNKDYVFRIK